MAAKKNTFRCATGFLILLMGARKILLRIGGAWKNCFKKLTTYLATIEETETKSFKRR
jgi:hypothetical protein